MKICKMDDYTWWIGPTLEACIASYIAETDDAESVMDAFAVPDSDLDMLVFYDADENGTQTGETRSFREQLAIEIEKGGSFPRMLASVDY